MAKHDHSHDHDNDPHYNHKAATTCKTTPIYVWYFSFGLTLAVGACLAMLLCIQINDSYKWWMAAIGWFCGINVAAFILMPWDKCLAKNGSHNRVPEGVLIGIAALFGFPMIWLSTCMFHHKTQKTEFRRPLIWVTCIDIALLIGLIAYLIWAAVEDKTV